MGAEFAFVSLDNTTGKTKPADRLVIRSRCMQGINKKENSRRSLRAVRKAAAAAEKNPQAQSGVLKAPTAGSGSAASSTEAEELARLRDATMRYVQRYAGPTLDFEIIRFFHQDTSFYPRELLGTFSIFRDLKGLMYPLHNRVQISELSPSGGSWLIDHTPFRHAVFLTVEAYREYMVDGALSASTYMRYRATILLLKARLSEELVGFSAETTIYVVNILTTIAVWLGRPAEVASHVNALKIIIAKCGGQLFLKNRPSLEYFFHTLDLANTLSSGDTSNPPGFRNSSEISCSNYPESGISQLNAIPLSPLLSYTLDRQVVKVLDDMRHIAARINDDLARGMLLDTDIFKNLHRSVQPRLISLQVLSEDPDSECLRLGMLSFLGMSTFRVPSNLGARRLRAYPHLTNNFRKACQAVEPSTLGMSTLVLWLLTIGTMSVFEVDDEEWLVEKWKNVVMIIPGVRLSWEDARRHLRDILWLDAIHDRPGQDAYESLMTRAFKDT
ncbi:hypothetical protein S40288_01018 [Stachybotrys chartarum IBT 40288]|nr:hypothetical protein S40288_01018 [Stachybotrys chartarum IBT 40288]